MIFLSKNKVERAKQMEETERKSKPLQISISQFFATAYIYPIEF